MAITSEQVRAGRALLRWEQSKLAEKSGISLPAIKRMETVQGPLAAQARTIEAIQAAFSRAGVEFIPENGGGAGVRMKKPKVPK
jgi:transcriptional regulator with XRE-family HTH domain